MNVVELVNALEPLAGIGCVTVRVGYDVYGVSSVGTIPTGETQSDGAEIYQVVINADKVTTPRMSG